MSLSIKGKIILLLFILAFSGFFFFKSMSNTIDLDEKGVSKSSINKLLYERKNKDSITLENLKRDIENIFTNQMLSTVDIEPVCSDSLVNKAKNLFKSDGETINKLKTINRLDGFIDEITSVCYQAQIMYLVGKEKAGTITDDDIDKFSDEVWNKYFFSEQELEREIELSVEKFVAEIEENHTSLFNEINDRYDIDIKDALAKSSAEHNIPKLNEFIREQSGYSVATSIGALIAGKQMGDLSSALVTRLGKVSKKSKSLKGKGIKSMIAGVALAGVTEMVMYNRSSDELKNGIRKQMSIMQEAVLYGTDESNGIIENMSSMLSKYQIDEESKVSSILGLGDQT